MKVGLVVNLKEMICILVQWFIVLAACAVFILLYNISVYDIEKQIQKSKNGEYAMQIHDRIEHEQLIRYFEDEKERQKLLRLSNRLAMQAQFRYYELIKQPVNILESEFPDDILLRYNSSSTLEGKNNAKFVKAIQVSNNVFEDFSIQAEEGRLIDQTNYDWDPTKTSIDCVLGWNYHKYYPIGSKIRVVYLNKPITLNVIGIMRKNSRIFHNNDFLNIDSYILMPSLNINYQAYTMEDVTFQVSLASQKINGLFLINDTSDILECLIFLRQLESEFAVPNFYISGIGNKRHIVILAALIHRIPYRQLVSLLLITGIAATFLHIKWLLANRYKLMIKIRIALLGNVAAFAATGLVYLIQLMIFSGTLPFNIKSLLLPLVLCFFSEVVDLIIKYRKVVSS